MVSKSHISDFVYLDLMVIKSVCMQKVIPLSTQFYNSLRFIMTVFPKTMININQRNVVFCRTKRAINQKEKAEPLK